MKQILEVRAYNGTSCCGLEEWYGVTSCEGMDDNLPVPNRSAQFLTTAGAQTLRCAEALKRNNFVPVFKFQNSNTGRIVTMWARGRNFELIQEPKAPKKRSMKSASKKTRKTTRDD